MTGSQHARFVAGCLTLVSIFFWAPLCRADAAGFADRFDLSADEFASAGRNNYVILEPGYQLLLEAKVLDRTSRLLVTVMPQTEVVSGVVTRMVESQEMGGGEVPRRVTRHYLAIARATNDVYCFGRAVDRYDTWRSAGHAGGWRAGEKGARYGLWMPANPQAGQKFYTALAPKVCMDRSEVAALAATVRVPANRYDRCVQLLETTPLSSKRKTEKVYAPGIGLIQDGRFKLVRAGFGVTPRREPAELVAEAKARAKAAGEPTEPIIPHEVARAALDGVGNDPQCEEVWATAINDPALSPDQRKDLIEDLNTDGFVDASNVTPEELPLVLNRLALIEEYAPEALDDVTADAFAEAYKDLVHIADRLTQ